MYTPMRLVDLLAQIVLGEDSSCQFKADIRNAESLAAEMVAFTNSAGGTIFIGVADDGALPSLAREDVSRINQLISNAARQLVRSSLTVLTENAVLESGRIVIVLRVPAGLDKSRVIWLKCGADKWRVNLKEELRRLFQISDQFHADKLHFRDFLHVYRWEFSETPPVLIKNTENIASTVAILRERLLPLDQFSGAFIDELNELALDLTGDIALEASGEEIIIAKEVLSEVIANLE